MAQKRKAADGQGVCVNVGLVGAGVVGGGVIEILTEHAERFMKTGVEFKVVRIAVRDAKKKRDFAIPKDCIVTENPMDVVNDGQIDIVVELMGGVGLAKDVVFGALKAGKHVVTANKALVAKHISEIDKLEASSNGSLGVEAAVCGGIPVIRTLQTSLFGDQVTRISGIMNGTTNFILTKMEKEGADYMDVLKEAQALGYAEADPTADVDGYDARAKLAILTKLAYGLAVDEEKIPTSGISKVSKDDFAYAAMLNSKIKLLGISKLIENNEISSFVSCVLVPDSNQLGDIQGATNGVEICSKSLQSTFLVGQGAGRYPTANSVVSDILAIAQDICGKPFPVESTGLSLASDFSSRFYLRFTIEDGIGIIERIGSICAKAGVSIDSVLQTPIQDTKRVPFVLTTNVCKRSQVETVCANFSKEKFSVDTPVIMPFLE